MKTSKHTIYEHITYKYIYSGLISILLIVLFFMNANNVLAQEAEKEEISSEVEAPCHGGKKITICHKTHSEHNPWVTIEINKSAWPHHKAHGDYKGPCKCEECPIIIDVLQTNINLGTFFPGGTYELPSDNGDGNIIEFILSGGKNTEYSIDYEMELVCQMGAGTAEIVNWEWEVADIETNGRYGHRHRKRNCGFHHRGLYHRHNWGKCEAIAKFRMTALELRLSENASPGPMTFTITLSATADL